MKEGKIMLKRKLNEKGFTLIEVVVTLILVGTTAVLAGMWIVNVANGYVFAKMNADTVQKGQLALTRLTKEFSAIQSVTAASGAGITYTRIDSVLNNTVVTYTVRVQSGELQLQQVTGEPGAPWYTLTDNVSSGGLSFRYCNDIDSSGTQVCESDWPTTGTRRVIEIKLTLKGANDVPSEFTRRVAPRNL
jgi:prepilin-type N-terminal cleavage/methylation domain-containing protein